MRHLLGKLSFYLSDCLSFFSFHLIWQSTTANSHAKYCEVSPALAEVNTYVPFEILFVDSSDKFLFCILSWFLSSINDGINPIWLEPIRCRSNVRKNAQTYLVFYSGWLHAGISQPLSHTTSTSLYQLPCPCLLSLSLSCIASCICLILCITVQANLNDDKVLCLLQWQSDPLLLHSTFLILFLFCSTQWRYQTGTTRLQSMKVGCPLIRQIQTYMRTNARMCVCVCVCVCVRAHTHTHTLKNRTPRL